MMIFPKGRAWNNASVDERRREERYAIDLPAEVSCLGSEPTDQWLEMRTKNISHGGAFLTGEEPLAVGSSLKLIIYMLNQSPALKILLTGRVSRAEETGMAVVFSKHFDILPMHQA